MTLWTWNSEQVRFAARKSREVLSKLFSRSFCPHYSCPFLSLSTFCVQVLSKSPRLTTIMTTRSERDTIWPSSTSWMKMGSSLTCLLPSWYSVSLVPFLLQWGHFHRDSWLCSGNPFCLRLIFFHFHLPCLSQRAWSDSRPEQPSFRHSRTEASLKRSETTLWLCQFAGRLWFYECRLF